MKSSNIYKDKFKKFGYSPKSLLWKSRGAAHQRFRQFWAEIDFSGKKVLDVGCGFGEFGKFILKRYKDVDYTGIDKEPEFIKQATKVVPNGKFNVVDYTDLNDQYDVVVASGVLNSNVGLRSRGVSDPKESAERNLKYRKESIKKMFTLTSNVLAFNMTGGHPRPINNPDSNLWYSDSLEILTFCMTLTRRVILRHHYNPKDFTVFMYKVK